jgi:DNA end-binding protein Ku
MRSMWKGAISFGLVMIPIKLYAATEQRDVSFRQVHAADGGRIRFQRVCSVCGQEVPYADVAKGYELPDGEMVVLTDDDFAELPLPTTRSIDVVQFSPAEQVDPIMHGRSYYTEPEQAGVRAYVLLREALADSGMVAIARVALRQREALAAVRVRDDLLVLDTLLWPDEVRTPDFGFLDDDVPVRQQELKMASSLIDSMTTDFDPSEFHDGYREALEELVAAKVAGREVTAPVIPLAPEGAGSLADALRASLEAAGGRRGAAAGDGGGSGRGSGGRSAAGGRAGSGGRSAAGGSAASKGRSAGDGKGKRPAKPRRETA